MSLDCCIVSGLKESSRAYFSLFEKGDRPTRRYRLMEDIPLAGSGRLQTNIGDSQLVIHIHTYISLKCTKGYVC